MGDALLKVTAKQLDNGGIEDITTDKRVNDGSSACARRLRPLLCSPTTRGRQGAKPGRPVRPPALLVLLTFT